MTVSGIGTALYLAGSGDLGFVAGADSGVDISGSANSLYQSGDAGGITISGDDNAVSLTGAGDAIHLSGVGSLIISGGSGDALYSAGGNNTFQYGADFQNDVFQQSADHGAAPSGRIEFLDATANELWFERGGDSLIVEELGTQNQLTISGWFGDSGSRVQDLRTSDNRFLDAGVDDLVQAMATYASARTGFSPAAAPAMPQDSALQAAISSAWHS